MKTLLFILLVVFASCEKDIPEEPTQRICWTCNYLYIGQIPPQTRNFCDGTDIKLPSGDITEVQIRQFEREHYIQGVLTVKCKSYQEK